MHTSVRAIVRDYDTAEIVNMLAFYSIQAEDSRKEPNTQSLVDKELEVARARVHRKRAGGKLGKL